MAEEEKPSWYLGDPEPAEPVHPALDRSEERLEAEREAAVAWLAEKWTQERVCPICGTSDWIIADAAQLPLYGDSDRMYPLIPVGCKNCSYTHLFNGIYMGVITDADPPEQ
jgi:hypothetical protein